MDFIFGNTTDKKLIDAIINSSYLSVKEHNTKDLFRYGKIELIAKKKFDNYGNFIEYNKLDFKLKPHYYFNDDKHNGNLMTINQTLEVLNDIYNKLNIDNPNKIKVTTIENGINIIPDMYDSKDIVTQSLCFKKNQLLRVRSDWEYYKTTKEFNTNPTIYAKLYHKGEDKGFSNLYPNEVHANTFRYELGNSTNRKLIKTFGVETFNDLLSLDAHKQFSEYLLCNWDYVLLLDEINDDNDLTSPIYYDDKRHFRNGLNNARVEYYKTNGIWHKEIKKLIEHTQQQQLGKMHIPTLMDSWNLHRNNKIDIVGICTEERKCKITGLDISMQKDNSIYLCFEGLRYYFEKHPLIYTNIARKYLKGDKINLGLEEQFYYIAHNIRNQNTNQIHNRRKFEQRNYPPNQLRLF